MATSKEAFALGGVVDRLREEPDEGELHIVRVDAALTTGSDDEPVVRLTITLSDPAPGLETWPSEDIWRLRQRVDRLVSLSEPALPRAVIDLQPETPDAED